VKASEIKDRESFERWLKARPAETGGLESTILAVRIAARMLPLTLRDKSSRDDIRSLPILTAVSLRAIAVARALTLAPARATELQGRASSSAAAYSAASSSAAAYSAASSSAAAYSAAYSAASSSAASSSAAAYSAASSSAADSAADSARSAAYSAARSPIWGAVRADCATIEKSNWESLRTLPLWPEGVARPGGLGDPQVLRDALRQRTNPHVWLRWYDRVLNGTPASEEIELLYCDAALDELWDKENGFQLATDWIAKRLEEVEGRDRLIEAKNAIEAGLGVTAVIENHQVHIKPTTSEPDREACGKPLARLLHAELLKALPALIGQTRRYGNKEGWTGIDIAAEEYAAFVDRNLEDISTEIATFWILSAKLAGFIDQDNGLKNGNASFAGPLDAEVRRAIQDALVPGAPLVRQFPTGLALDEDHIRFRQPPEQTRIATQLLQSAKRGQVVHGPSADLITSLESGALRQGPQGTKLGSWIGRTTRAIVLAIGLGVAAFSTGVAQKIGEQFAERSEMVRRFADFLVKEEPRIIEMTKDLPPDISAQIREIIRRIREGQLPPPPPSAPPTTGV
jgi:hypothetical protein